MTSRKHDQIHLIAHDIVLLIVSESMYIQIDYEINHFVATTLL